VDVAKGKAVYAMKFVENYLILLLYFRCEGEMSNMGRFEARLVQDAVFLLPA
jgi:hypothetical protein